MQMNIRFNHVVTKFIFQLMYLLHVSKQDLLPFQALTLGSNALVLTKRQCDVVIKSMDSLCQTAGVQIPSSPLTSWAILGITCGTEIVLATP